MRRRASLSPAHSSPRKFWIALLKLLKQPHECWVLHNAHTHLHTHWLSLGYIMRAALDKEVWNGAGRRVKSQPVAAGESHHGWPTKVSSPVTTGVRNEPRAKSNPDGDILKRLSLNMLSRILFKPGFSSPHWHKLTRAQIQRNNRGCFHLQSTCLQFVDAINSFFWALYALYKKITSGLDKYFELLKNSRCYLKSGVSNIRPVGKNRRTLGFRLASNWEKNK